MCGIVGVLARSAEGGVDPGLVRKMAAALAHRGPDDEGYFVQRQVALGNRRLSIIDLEQGRQPITTPDGRYTIVYNGEVFNYRDLRKELEGGGAKFRTASDTEVVLQGFARYGPPFLNRLEGMYAFLIYDMKESVLYAARDPFGIKPLYLAEAGDLLYAASEIKALLAGADLERKMDLAALASYLRCGYILGRETLLSSVRRVTPGCVLVVPHTGKIREEAFSDRLLPRALAGGGGDVESLRGVLIHAIERALVADVPVGLYLSGGIDSSLIAAVVKKELGRDLRSFSVRFPGVEGFDEGPQAERVARELGLEHESISASPEDFLDLNALARTLEEPMVDPSAVPLLNLSRNAARSVKVVLSGEGGDELFGGYHRYFWDRLVTKYRDELPWAARRLAEGMASLGSKRLRRRVEKLRETADLPRPVRYLTWFSSFRGEELDELPREALPGDLLERRVTQAFGVASELPFGFQAQWVDLVTYLRDDLLAKADKMSMASSLEVRVPFLQSDVAHAAFSFSANEHTGAFSTKRVLRKLLERYLPPEITRRKKQGFEIPIGLWLRGPLEPLIERYLSRKTVENRGLWSFEVVDRIRAEHASGRADRGPALFSLALLEAWCQEFLSS